MDREQRKEVIQEWVRTYVLTENWREETFMNSMLPFFVWKALLPSSKKHFWDLALHFMKVVKKSPKNPFSQKLYNCTVSHWLLFYGVEAQHQKNPPKSSPTGSTQQPHAYGWMNHESWHEFIGLFQKTLEGDWKRQSSSKALDFLILPLDFLLSIFSVKCITPLTKWECSWVFCWCLKVASIFCHKIPRIIWFSNFIWV